MCRYKLENLRKIQMGFKTKIYFENDSLHTNLSNFISNLVIEDENNIGIGI